MMNQIFMGGTHILDETSAQLPKHLFIYKEKVEQKDNEKSRLSMPSLPINTQQINSRIRKPLIL